MSETVWITRKPGASLAHVSCFKAKDVVKALPLLERRWDQPSKTWLVHVRVLNQLVADLRAHGFSVLTDIKDYGDMAPAKPTGTWATMMYTELGRDLGDKAHRALARVLHPDAGGDVEVMKQLNAARDQAEK